MQANPFSSMERPVLAGRQGAVAAAHPLAVAAAQEILGAEGSAADATIAAQAVIGVVSPDACGIGGDGFFLITSPDHGTLAVNGAGPAAAAQTTSATDGGASVTVPGLVEGWHQLSSRWGRLPLARCLRPAIRLARMGVRLDGHLVNAVRAQEHRLVRGGAHRWALMSLREGERWEQPHLANALDEIATSGATGFYRGTLAQQIVHAVRADGGSLTLDDLAQPVASIDTPIEVEWERLRVFVQPPISQGVLLAMALLNMPDAANTATSDLDHMGIELTKAAFEYRNRVAEGQELLNIRLDADPNAAVGRQGPRAYLHTAGCCVADGEGIVVASLASVFDDFGSGVFVPEGGFILNNRGGGFTEGANAFAPGKRPVHTLAPIIVTDGETTTGLSTPGADGQVQTLLQVLTRWRSGEADLARAVAYPRWRSEGGRLLVEHSHPHREALLARKHEIVDAATGDMRFGAVTCAGISGQTPFALSDWRRLTWSGIC